MTHVAVERWGRAWLERGKLECRFLKPVYDGHLAVVTGKAADEVLALAVESDAGLCATGRASLATGSASPPSIEDFEQASPPATRPAADERTLAPGTRLPIVPFRASAEYSARYLADIGETHAIYAEEALCHPGILLRLCNWALTQNVVLGPWIHAGSKVQNFAAVHVGRELAVRAVVTGNYERKGHRMVELEALVLADACTPIARVEHTAICRPRQSPSQTI